jgi:hypothetical protein
MFQGRGDYPGPPPGPPGQPPLGPPGGPLGPGMQQPGMQPSGMQPSGMQPSGMQPSGMQPTGMQQGGSDWNAQAPPTGQDTWNPQPPPQQPLPGLLGALGQGLGVGVGMGLGPMIPPTLPPGAEGGGPPPLTPGGTTLGNPSPPHGSGGSPHSLTPPGLPSPDAPVFNCPRRPNLGREGRSILLRANHFQISMPRGFIHHYHVSIVPDKCPRRVNREIIQTMVHAYSKIFGNLKPVFDGRSNLYVRDPLPIGNDQVELEVTLDGEGKDRVFRVTMKWAAQVSLFALEEALEGRTRQIPFDAIQALDVVMRHLPRYQTHVVRNFPVGDQLSKIHQENY